MESSLFKSKESLKLIKAVPGLKSIWNQTFSDKALEEKYRKFPSNMANTFFYINWFIQLIFAITTVSIIETNQEEDYGRLSQLLCLFFLPVLLISQGILSLYVYLKKIRISSSILIFTQISLVGLFSGILSLYIKLSEIDNGSPVRLQSYALLFFSVSLNTSFSYSLLRSTIAFLFEISIISLYFYTADSSVVLTEILTFSQMFALLEFIFAQMEFYNRYMFIKALNSKLKSNYFYDILNKIKTSIVIFKDGQLFFRNERSNSIINQFSQVFEGKIDHLSLVEKINAAFSKTDRADDSPVLKKATANLILDTKTLFFEKEGIRTELGPNKEAKVEFRRLGVYQLNEGEKRQVVEIYMSYHTFFNEEFIEILVNDISEMVEAEDLRQVTQWRNKVVSKLSHEFIHPLMGAQQMLNKNYELLMHQGLVDQSIPALVDNTKKISNMVDMLFLLTKEVTEFLSYKTTLAKAESLKEVNLKSTIDWCQEVCATVIIQPEFARKKIFFEEKYGQEFYGLCEPKIRVAESNFRGMMLNIFLMAIKLVESGRIEIFFDIKFKKGELDSLLLETNKVVGYFKIEFKSRFSLEEIKNISFNSEYSKFQGVDISHEIIIKLAKKMQIPLNFQEKGPIMTINFEIPILSLEEEIDNESSFNQSIQTEQEATGIYLTEETKDLIEGNKKPQIRRPRKQQAATIKRSKSDLVQVESVSKARRIQRDREIREKLRRGATLEGKCPLLDELHTNRFFFDLFSHSSKINPNLENKKSSGVSNKRAIIVADDFDHTREIMAKMLRSVVSKSFEVLEVSDGLDLLHKVIEIENSSSFSRIELVVSDEHMCYVNGSSAFKILNEWFQDKKIRTFKKVSCTAFTDEQNLLAIQSSDPDAILNKPVSKTDLVEILHDFGI